MIFILDFLFGAIFGGCVGFFTFALASVSKNNYPKNEKKDEV